MPNRTLNWDVNPDTTVTGYHIQYAVDPGTGLPPSDGSFSDLDDVAGRENNSYVHDDGGTTYWYRVAADNPNGRGPYSVPFRVWAITSADLCAVSGVLTDPAGQAIEGGEVIIELSSEFGKVLSDVFNLGQANSTPILTNANGQWSVNLVRQNKVSPSGSYYTFRFHDAQEKQIRGPEKKVVPDEASKLYNDLQAPS